jgi:hypothetical protein
MPPQKSLSQLVASNWGLHWQQIPSEEQQAEDVPRGFLPLEKAMVLAAMGPAVTRSLLPPMLESEFSVSLLSAPETTLAEIPLRKMADVLEVRISNPPKSEAIFPLRVT